MFDTEYSGTTIRYIEFANVWEVIRDRTPIGQSSSLTGAKALVDKLLKGEKKFRRVPIIGVFGYGTGLREAMITSIVEGENGREPVDCWVSLKEPDGRFRRFKERLDCCYPRTPENMELMKQYRAISEQRAALAEKQREIAHKMMVKLDRKYLEEFAQQKEGGNGTALGDS